MTSQELAGGSISHSDKIALEGRLGVRLVAHVLQRPLMGTFSSLQEVGFTFFNELKDTAGDRLKSSCPERWSSAGKPAPKKSNKSASHGRAVELASDLDSVVIGWNRTFAQRDIHALAISLRRCALGAPSLAGEPLRAEKG